jgi:hypothetical protein
MAREIWMLGMVTAAVSLGCQYRSAADKQRANVAASRQVASSGRVVNGLWRPALSCPDTGDVINAVLGDWFGNRRHFPGGKKRSFVYYRVPNLDTIRVHAYQLPASFRPEASGVKFILTHDLKGDRALSGSSPGDIGVRFDVFKAIRPGVVEFVFCLLKYEDRGTMCGVSVTYRVVKSKDGWQAKLVMLDG